MVIILFIFNTIEWLGRKDQFAIENIIDKWQPIFRYLFYYIIVYFIFWYGGKEQQFIYFQF